jgi:hypothetical protein
MSKDVSKSELATKIYNEMKDDPKCKIVAILKGKYAVDGIKKIFFPDSDKKGTTWAKRWTSSEKSQSLLIISEYKKRVNTTIGCKFIIGNLKTGSSLGTDWRNYEEGVIELKKIGIL